jgi:hypothetical protein
LQTGHLFAVTLIFPKGFEIASSTPVEFTIKSSHPQYPVLKARIIQTPRPVPAPSTPPSPHALAKPPFPGPVYELAVSSEFGCARQGLMLI